MVRRVSGMAGVAWLCIAALQAPFMHVHPQDPGHRHATGLSHGHFGHAGTKHHTSHQHAKWDHADRGETTVWQEWIPAAAPRITVEHAVTEGRPAWEPRLVCLYTALELVVRSHDPPDLAYSSARAPPV